MLTGVCGPLLPLLSLQSVLHRGAISQFKGLLCFPRAACLSPSPLLFSVRGHQASSPLWVHPVLCARVSAPEVHSFPFSLPSTVSSSGMPVLSPLGPHHYRTYYPSICPSICPSAIYPLSPAIRQGFCLFPSCRSPRAWNSAWNTGGFPCFPED